MGKYSSMHAHDCPEVGGGLPVQDEPSKTKTPAITTTTTTTTIAATITAGRWAPDGSAFVTASHDKVVTLYTLRAGGDGTGADGVGGTGYEQVGGWRTQSRHLCD